MNEIESCIKSMEERLSILEAWHKESMDHCISCGKIVPASKEFQLVYCEECTIKLMEKDIAEGNP